MCFGVRTVALWGFLGTSLLAAPPHAPVELSLSPYYGFRPLTVTAKIGIEPNSLNVGWCLTWDSNYVAGRHCESFTDGAYEPRTRFYTLKLETPKTREEEIETTYSIYATVIRVRDFQNTPPQMVRVLPTPF